MVSGLTVVFEKVKLINPRRNPRISTSDGLFKRGTFLQSVSQTLPTTHVVRQKIELFCFGFSSLWLRGREKGKKGIDTVFQLIVCFDV